MAWGNVSWATNDVISLTKMTQINDNIDMAKDEVEFTILFNGEVTDTATVDQSDLVDFSIDSTLIKDGVSGAQTELNYSVSGLDDGLHTFVFGLDSGTPEYTYRWVKTPDINYVSIWFTSFANENSNDGNYYGFREVTIIGHRESETW